MKLRNIILSLALTLSLLFSSIVQSQAVPVINEMKWHPGHYIMLVGSNKDSSLYMNPVYKELSAHQFQGVAIRYKWSELETSKDVYDFRSIDKQIAGLALRNKRLIILLEYKSFDSEIRIPNYLRTVMYEGGVFPLNGGGYNIKLWNNNVKNRLIALGQALGDHLDADPNFEGFGLQETSMGDPVKPLTSVQLNAFYDNLIVVDAKLKQSFPNTMTFQLTNFPRSQLDVIINGLKSIGATLGATDIFLQEPGLFVKGTKYTSEGLYLRFPALSNVIPLLAQVEKSNYENTRWDNTGYKPTVTELLNFARDNLKVNYILWTRSPEYFGSVLAVMKQTRQASTPSGGLNSICPSVILNCVK